MKKNDEKDYFAPMRSDGCDIIQESTKTVPDCVVAIACSTGGPKSLQEVITVLPKNLNAPVLIVQHMPKGFTKSLAQRLDSMSEMTVKEADEGDVLYCGHVYVAQGGKHMEVHKDVQGRFVITYQDMPVREGVKPCANYMFESLIQTNFKKIVCVVMTGMGADGLEGIRHLKASKDVYVIAQDRESSVIYGMPKCIVEAGLSNQEVALNQIASQILLQIGIRK